MGNCVWQLRQTESDLLYRVLGELNNETGSYYNSVRLKIPIKPINKKVKSVDTAKLVHSTDYYESLLRAYFRLDIDLSECYAKWSEAHAHFKGEAHKFYAIRVLDQDPVENLFSFICSQNNHISRYLQSNTIKPNRGFYVLCQCFSISSLVEKLCKNYGPKICDLNGVTYHAFPNFDELAYSKVTY